MNEKTVNVEVFRINDDGETTDTISIMVSAEYAHLLPYIEITTGKTTEGMHFVCAKTKGDCQCDLLMEYFGRGWSARTLEESLKTLLHRCATIHQED